MSNVERAKTSRGHGAPQTLEPSRPSTQDLLAHLGATLDGLTSAEAERRLAQVGANEIAKRHRSILDAILSYFWGPIPALIEIAAVLSASVRHWGDFAIIVAMLLVNAGVGFWQEHQAKNAIALLSDARGRRVGRAEAFLHAAAFRRAHRVSPRAG